MIIGNNKIISLVICLSFVFSIHSSVIQPDGFSIITPIFSRIYKLKFQYAARQNQPLATSTFSVYWNNDLITRICPLNYNVVSRQFILYKIKAGNNQLKFVGQGASDSYGATIDNVRIVGLDNIQVNVLNGAFQNPFTNGDFSYQVIPGWNGRTEIGNGALYNSKWPKNNQVMQLDVDYNANVSQIFVADSLLQFIDKKVSYTLKLQYAARENQPLNTSTFSIYWNNKQILKITPSNYSIGSVQYILTPQLNEGSNKLTLVGQGPSDSYGATVDNVRILGSDNSQVNVLNGNFQNPKTNGGYNMQVIPGWTGVTQIGDSSLYNAKWPKNNQVVELDGNENVKMSQVFIVDKKFRFISLKTPPC